MCYVSQMCQIFRTVIHNCSYFPIQFNTRRKSKSNQQVLFFINRSDISILDNFRQLVLIGSRKQYTLRYNLHFCEELFIILLYCLLAEYMGHLYRVQILSVVYLKGAMWDTSAGSKVIFTVTASLQAYTYMYFLKNN